MRHVHFSPYGGRTFGESSRNSEHRRVFHQCHQSRRCQHGQVSRPHRRCEIFRLYDSPAGMFQSFFQHSHFFLMVLHSIAFSRILTKSAAKNNDFVFQSAFCTDRLFSYLCHSFGFAAPNCYGSAIKRESGANPEQTRCCKFLPKSLNTSQATVRHRMGRHSKTEQVRRPAKKQTQF